MLPLESISRPFSCHTHAVNFPFQVCFQLFFFGNLFLCRNPHKISILLLLLFPTMLSWHFISKEAYVLNQLSSMIHPSFYHFSQLTKKGERVWVTNMKNSWRALDMSVNFIRKLYWSRRWGTKIDIWFQLSYFKHIYEQMYKFLKDARTQLFTYLNNWKSNSWCN